MSKHFYFSGTPLAGLVKVKKRLIDDSRGYFSRFFCTEEFKEIGFNQPIAQINHSLTKQKGSIRGMHFQYPPFSETKIVSCTKGKILDVVVDIREGSSTFLQWYAEELSADNQTTLYIPQGFAHGFQALTEGCEIIYLVSTKYAPDAEGAINPLDPKIAIDWPLEVTDISERDRTHPQLNEQFRGIAI